MQRLEVSGAVRPLLESLGVKGLISDKNTSISHEKLYKFIIPRAILIRMRNVSNKICRENQNKDFTFNNLFTPRK